MFRDGMVAGQRQAVSDFGGVRAHMESFDTGWMAVETGQTGRLGEQKAVGLGAKGGDTDALK